MKPYDLICATIDDTDQVKDFLYHIKKIAKENSKLYKINLILIDQYDSNRSLIFKEILPETQYIKSQKKGLSLNRNIGIKVSKASIYSFIDTDCRFEKNFFKEIKIIDEAGIYEKIYGRILDLDRNEKIFKNWPQKNKSLRKYEEWIFSTSVNIVYKGKKELFDEKLGLGTEYGSCEDIDYAIRKQGKSFYNPNVIIKHPKQSFNDIPKEKIKSYAQGFGALCKKHFSFYSITFFCISILYKIYSILINKSTFTKSYISIKYRINGFKKF